MSIYQDRPCTCMFFFADGPRGTGTPACPEPAKGPVRSWKGHRVNLRSENAKNHPRPNPFKINTYNLIQNKRLHLPIESISFKKQGGGGVSNRLTQGAAYLVSKGCVSDFFQPQTTAHSLRPDRLHLPLNLQNLPRPPLALQIIKILQGAAPLVLKGAGF
jgi:hypothetical protein